MKRRFIDLSSGNIRLSGYNYGKYPLHRFRCFSYAENAGGRYPILIQSTGYDEWHRECFRERLQSDIFAVEYVREGIFRFQQDGTVLRVHPGEIFLVRLGTDSSMCCETETAMKRTVIMSGPMIGPVLELLGLDQVNRIVPEDPSRLDAMFDRLYELGARDTPSSYRAASAECYAMLLELSAQNSAMHRPVELQRVLEYIHENLSEQLTLEKLTAHAAVSGATLQRYFRKYLHTSPIDYCLDRKMEKAMSLLRLHIYSVKEIAAMMKYSSPQYFAAEFRKHFGIAPRDVK